MISSEELIAKLKNALQTDGDFPVSAQIVAELRQLTSDPKTTAEQITEVILREPSLGTRVLHFVNSAFMRRAKPIMTVSQAVVQIGMKPLSELCSGLVLMQKFIPTARRSSPFALCLKRTILVSLLNSSLNLAVSTNQNKKSDESGYLLGQLSELGPLLLGFYFPEILEAATKRSEEKNQDLSESIRDLTGLHPCKLSAEVVSALGLPPYFNEVFELATSDQMQQTLDATNDSAKLKAAKTLCGASLLSSTLASGRGKPELDHVLKQVKDSLNLKPEVLNDTIISINTTFRDHCSSLDIELPALPEYLSSYSANPSNLDSDGTGNSAEFDSFLKEVRKMVEDREPTASIITSVMETIAFALKFDRVFLTLVGAGKQKLLGRMLLGRVNNFDPKKFEKSLSTPGNCPAIKAFKEGRPVFKGDPLFENGWPLVALPIGLGVRSIGVIYADRSPENPLSSEQGLTPKEQAAFSILADLLERSVSSQARGS